MAYGSEARLILPAVPLRGSHLRETAFQMPRRSSLKKTQTVGQTGVPRRWHERPSWGLHTGEWDIVIAMAHNRQYHKSTAGSMTSSDESSG
jgi:hypothetical protein